MAQNKINVQKHLLLLLTLFSFHTSYALECGDYYLQGKVQRTLSYLEDRYKIEPEKIEFTATKGYPILVHNQTAAIEKTIKIPDMKPIVDETQYDTIVLGGGPAGLTNSLYLTDKGKKVLLIEKEAKLGGLGAGSELNGIRAGGGAAYSAGPDGIKQYRIFQHIGLGNYKQKLSIYEPIDSYFWNGKMYLGVWEDHTLEKLPASFALFKHALKKFEKMGAYETATELGLKTDEMSMAEFVRKMPETVQSWNDQTSKEVFRKFQEDAKVNRDDPMADVLGLLNLYGRSALGGETDAISARQFGDFYVSELDTRYTGMLGTGDVTHAIIKKLKTPIKGVKRKFTPKTNSTILNVSNTPAGVTVTYLKDGKVFEAKAKKAVFAAPINLAPKLIEGFSTQAANRVAVINKRPLTDYIVHTVRVKGHPFRETYDLWLKSDDYTKDMPTDMILGRWMDPKINGYEGMRNFEKAPTDDYGVLTIYHPQSFREHGKDMNNDDMKKKAEFAVEKLKEWISPYLKQKFGTKIEVELIETFRWPGSIHQVTPGTLKESKVLAEPFGNIHFANNTLGAPELEEALERGKEAADKIIEEIDP